MRLTSLHFDWNTISRCLLACGLGIGIACPVLSQELPQSNHLAEVGLCRVDDQRPGPLGLGRLFAGIDRECLLCHSSGNQGGYAGPLSLREAKIWKESDAHSWAYAVLLNKESQQIGERLGNAKEIHRDARCLACHSGFPLHDVKLEKGLVPLALAEDPRHRLAWGVSCEACHGAAKAGQSGSTTLKGWLEPHREADWRTKYSAEQKQAEFGYYDVHSPLARARMCVSCHVGNAEEGRVITHEMYAAGHPPLPSFELETFQRQMPPHWQTKQADSDPSDKAKDARGLSTLRNMAIGAAVTWAEQLRLTAALANSEAQSPAEKTRWPELAQFECFACHHELRRTGWRGERRLGVTPGRPLLRGAPSPIFQAFLSITGGDKNALKQKEQAVLAAVSKRPFGPPAVELAPVLLDAAAWADDWAARLENAELDYDKQELLLELSSIASADVYEYDTARQLAWAFQTALRASESESESTEIKATMSEIQQMFLSNLPDARTLSGIDSIANANRELRFINLAEVFPVIAKYDASKFKLHFAKIHDQLKGSSKRP